MIPFVNIHAHRLSVRPEREWVLTSLKVEDYPPCPNDDARYSVGFHPWSIEQEDICSNLKRLRLSVANSQVVALGEMGLDKAIDTSLALQLGVLEAQMEVAEEFGLPVLLHIVRANQEIIEFCKVHKPSVPMILHGYKGGLQLAEDLMKEGISLSLGELLFFSEKVCSVASAIPLDRLFLETDESNESIELLYAETARLRKMEIPDLKQVMFDKAEKMFQKKEVNVGF